MTAQASCVHTYKFLRINQQHW